MKTDDVESASKLMEKGTLYVIVLILIVLRHTGLFTSYTMNSFIHIFFFIIVVIALPSVALKKNVWGTK